MGVSMTIDTVALEVPVAELARRMVSFERPLKQWGVWMTGSVKRNFDEQGRPEAWAPLKVKTLLARYGRTAAARKLREKAAETPRGKFDPSPVYFARSRSGGGVGALSTVSGFRRSARTGRILRSRHGGLNKFAKEGYAFRAAAVRAVLQGKILQDRGLLRASVTTAKAVKPGARTVTVGSNLVYAAAHQYGVPARKIPVRPFMVIQDDDRLEFADLLKRHLRGEHL